MRKFHYGLAFVTNSLASVVALLKARSPTNIPRFIPSAVILSINRCFIRWGIADVGVKCCKAIAPLVTHGDTESTVELERNVSWTKATSFDPAPSPINLGVSLAMGSMWFPTRFTKVGNCCLSFSKELGFITSTRECFAKLEVIGLNPFRIAARALTEPENSFSACMETRFGWTDNSKTPLYETC